MRFLKSDSVFVREPRSNRDKGRKKIYDDGRVMCGETRGETDDESI